MKKIEVNGREYDLEAALYKGHIDALIWLKENTGLSIKDIHKAIVGIGELTTGESMYDYLADIDNLKAWQALVWLCRRRADEVKIDPETGRSRWLTLGEASDFSVLDVHWVSEEPSATEAATDPKAQTASEADAAPAVEQTASTTPS